MLAVSCCLATTILSTIPLLLVAAQGWPYQEFEEQCFANFSTEPNCFCERPRGSQPGDVWFAQPMNTWSNAAFPLVGLMIALSTDLEYPRQFWKYHDNFLTQAKAMAIVYACLACLMGLGSAALHASMTETGRQIDQYCMFLIADYLLVYNVTRKFSWSLEKSVMSYVVGAILSLYAIFVSTDPRPKRIMFAMLVLVAVLMELQMQFMKRTARLEYLGVAIVCILTAAAVWIPSKSGGPLCNPESIWQGHALWHLLAAAALGFVFLYGLSEHAPQTTIATKQQSKDKRE